jgi:16S rRNA (guanine966-N2)-methyltransferase
LGSENWQAAVRRGNRGTAQVLIQKSKTGARGPASPHSRGTQSRVLRIIGGAWRGRRFRFPAQGEIRPTPDRVRETLFNWLATRVAGARCLDLFAGSGALGFEALSRGAAGVVFVERDRVAARELKTRLLEWGAGGAAVEVADALHFLRGSAAPFDIVFLDPPFTANLLPQAAALLEERGWLAADALIYIEQAARDEPPRLPQSWPLLKEKRAGEVRYHLYQRHVRGGAST